MPTAGNCCLSLSSFMLASSRTPQGFVSSFFHVILADSACVDWSWAVITQTPSLRLLPWLLRVTWRLKHRARHFDVAWQAFEATTCLQGTVGINNPSWVGYLISERRPTLRQLSLTLPRNLESSARKRWQKTPRIIGVVTITRMRRLTLESYLMSLSANCHINNW